MITRKVIFLVMQVLIVGKSLKKNFSFKTHVHSTLQLSKLLTKRSPFYASEAATILTESYNIAATMAVLTSVSSIKLIGNMFKFQDNVSRTNAVFWRTGTNGILSLLLAGLTYYVFNKTSNVLLKFDETSISLIDSAAKVTLKDPVEGRGGGFYSWKYKDIINYSFLPSEKLPIFFYIKESSTPVQSRVDGPFYLDLLPGQVHIFPIIFSVDQLEENLEDPSHHLTKITSQGFHVQSNFAKFINGLKIL